MFSPPLDEHRNNGRGSCTLCQLAKSSSTPGRLCAWCIAYIAWRKMHMPDGRERHHLMAWEHAQIARNVERYRARAELGLPIFDDDGKESAA